MCRSRILIALALLVLVVSPGLSEDTTDLSTLQHVIAKFYDSVDSGDVEARISLLAEDVIMMPNHWTMIRGKKEVSESFRRGASAVFRIKDHEALYLEIEEDLAYTANSYFYTYHTKDQPEQWHKTKNVHIWRRDSSGQWKLAVDIWNSDVPLAEFEQE